MVTNQAQFQKVPRSISTRGLIRIIYCFKLFSVMRRDNQASTAASDSADMHSLVFPMGADQTIYWTVRSRQGQSNAMRYAAVVLLLAVVGCSPPPTLVVDLVREPTRVQFLNRTDRDLSRCVFLVHGWEGSLASLPAHGQVTISRPLFASQSGLTRMHCEDHQRRWIEVIVSTQAVR